MPIDENSAEDLNNLLGLIRSHKQVEFVGLVTELAREAEMLYFRNVRAQEVVHGLHDQVVQLQHELDEAKAELANVRVLYNAASSTVLATNQLLDTAEHQVEHLRQVASYDSPEARAEIELGL